MPVVLPCEIDDGASEPYIAIDLGCTVVLRCRFLVGADKLSEVGDWV